MNSHQDLPVILHNEKRGLLTIEDGRLDVLQLSKDGRPPKRLLSSPVRNLLKARLAGTVHQLGQTRRLDLHTLIQKGRELRLSKMHVLVEPINGPEAEQWVELAMEVAYGAVRPERRVLLLVNPVGGKGKAKSIVRETVLPILEAAGCVLDVRETTHRLHAEEIAKEVALDYDVIATASGDGTAYEVLNGLAARPDARKALQIPIAPIPTGSANALCINLFGIKDTFNVALACLNIIKGQNLPLDLCSVLFLPSQTRRWSFLAIALGLMVDLDIGTENMRWIGDTRFVLGFLKGIATNKNHKCRIRLKVVESDKVSMARKARERMQRMGLPEVVGKGVLPDGMVSGKGKDLGPEGIVKGMNGMTLEGVAGGPGGRVDHSLGGLASPLGEVDGVEEGKPPANEAILEMRPLEPDDTWLTIESGATASAVKGVHASTNGQAEKGGWVDGQGILYVYAGMMPWIARDLMQWPVATSGEGVMDVVVQSIVPRTTLINAITGAEKGEAFWMDCQHYYKVSALIGENLDSEHQKLFTLDGEAFPFSSFHVEVHPRLANVLSLDGHFFVSEFLQKHHLKE